MKYIIKFERARRDLNPRPNAPQAFALSKLSHEPNNTIRKTNNSIEVQKARNEKSELENEILKKRKEVESAIKELKSGHTSSGDQNFNCLMICSFSS